MRFSGTESGSLRRVIFSISLHTRGLGIYDRVSRRSERGEGRLDSLAFEYHHGYNLTLINGFLTFVLPLLGARTPALPEYLFFATIETVCTSPIIRQAWTWLGAEAIR